MSVVKSVAYIILVLSPPILFTPLLLNFLGVDYYLSYKYDYLYSIKQFVPEELAKLFFFESIPLQAFRVNDVVVYFPGVFVETILGILIFAVLGIDLLTSVAKHKMKTPDLAALMMFCYAGMCIGAFPLHSLKEIPAFDILVDTPLIHTLFMFDSLCTSVVPPVMIVIELVTNGTLSANRGRHAALMITILFWSLCYAGVVFHQPWIMFFLHIGTQLLFCPVLLAITRQRFKKQTSLVQRGRGESGCIHGFHWMVIAFLYSVVFASGGFTVPVYLSKISQNYFDPLTSVFFGCRCGMIAYYLYCKDQLECDCIHHKEYSSFHIREGTKRD
uniref:Uncharacterized protein n=1 Tax=Aplanochytrium stocchinoi TaxID=215587 RepID=A0A7S3V224_9STRA